jgi:hypothetical protein
MRREMRNVYSFWLESLKGREHSEEMDIYEKIIITDTVFRKKYTTV